MPVLKSIVSLIVRSNAVAADLDAAAKRIVTDCLSAMTEEEKKLNKVSKILRLRVNSLLTEYVEAAHEQRPEAGFKDRGFNCLDLGGSRYRAIEPSFLHMVKPKGGIVPGTKLDSSIRNALSNIRKEKSVDTWLRNPAWGTVSAASKTSKKKAASAKQWHGDMIKTIRKEITERGLTKAQVAEWLNAMPAGKAKATKAA